MDKDLKYRPGLTDRKSIDEENHVVSAMVSVKELDRYKDVVLPQAFRGAGIRNWRKNPVIFLFHASWGFPAGRGQRLEILDDGLRGHTKFATEVGGSVGDAINAAWDMIVHDYIRAWSIGFWARAWEFDGERIAKLLKGMPDKVLVDVRRVLTSGELAEWSLVGIPASPSSLTESMAKSYGDPDALMKVAPAQIREVLEFTKQYEWRKDAHLEEWFVDNGCDPFCERTPQIIVPASECEVADLAGDLEGVARRDDDPTTLKEDPGDGIQKVGIEMKIEDPENSLARLVDSLTQHNVRRFQKFEGTLPAGEVVIAEDRNQLEALAASLEESASIIRKFLAEDDESPEERELREELGVLQVLTDAFGDAPPGVPESDDSDG